MTINELGILYKNEPTDKHFSELILAYRPVIKDNVSAMLRRKNMPLHNSDDISSEVEYFLYKNIARYFDPEKGEFESWAYRVTVQYFSRYIRSIAKKISVDSSVDVERLDLCEPDSSVSELMEEIDDMINKLPEDVSSTIKKHYYKDVSYVEISDISGESYRCVRNKCLFGIYKIKEHYENEAKGKN